MWREPISASSSEAHRRELRPPASRGARATRSRFARVGAGAPATYKHAPGTGRPSRPGLGATLRGRERAPAPQADRPTARPPPRQPAYRGCAARSATQGRNAGEFGWCSGRGRLRGAVRRWVSGLSTSTGGTGLLCLWSLCFCYSSPLRPALPGLLLLAGARILGALKLAARHSTAPKVRVRGGRSDAKAVHNAKLRQ